MKNVYNILAFNVTILLGLFSLVLVFSSLYHQSVPFALLFGAATLAIFWSGVRMFKKKNLKVFFAKIKDMSAVRTPEQAIAFYDVYVIFIVLLAGLMGFISAFFASSYEEAVRNSAVLSVLAVWIGCIWIGTKILKAKGRLLSPLDLLLIVASLLIAIRGGVFAGLLPIAYLTTRSSLKKANYVEPAKV